MIINKNFEAVIFDFDGTLVDTLYLHYNAYHEALLSYGIDLSYETFKSVGGGIALETIPRMTNNKILDSNIISKIHNDKKRIFLEKIRKEVIVPLQTSILLHVFYKRIPIALASSGSRIGIEMILNKLGWFEYFDVIVTGDDVRVGKPDPEIFLLASSKLKIKTEKCLVFEDSDDGLYASKHAGIQYIDVRNSLSNRLF